jgi:hypothetical protein
MQNCYFSAGPQLTTTRNIPDGVNARIELRDFFSFKVPDNEKFDLIYDYTSAVFPLSSF